MAVSAIESTDRVKRASAFPWLWAILLVGLTCLPYLAGWLLTPAEGQFGGLLSNPLDGNSYLAKMRLGAEGRLSFYLSYSPESQNGYYFYVPYLLWGYLTSRLGLSLTLGYHLGRVLAALFFLWTAWRFLAKFATSALHLRLSWTLVAISSGLGWLALPFGYLGMDLWVPEAISFYSMFANIHFPLATALSCWLFLSCTEVPVDQSRRTLVTRALRALACAAGLALVLPFAVATVYPVIAGVLVWKWVRQRRLPWANLLVAAISAIPVAAVGLYDLYIVAADPLIRVWTEQDVNPSPPLWGVALAYGLVLVLAAWGVWRAWRRREERLVPLLIWAIINVLVIYAPTVWQRRLIMGLHIPLCGLAGFGLAELAGLLARPERRRLWIASAVGLSAISNIVVMLIALSGVLSQDRHYYFSRAEGTAMAWLDQHAPAEAVVLAAPSTSLFVPVWAGQQVVYGHPLETAYAAARKREVESFFAAEMAPDEETDWLRTFRVCYLLWGPEEQKMARFEPEEKSYLSPVFQTGNVTLFEVRPPGAAACAGR